MIFKYENGICGICGVHMAESLFTGLESGYLTTLYSCDDCQRRVAY